MSKKYTDIELAREEFSRKARQLHRLEEAVRTAMFELDYDLRTLAYIAKEHPDLLDKQAVADLAYVLNRRKAITGIKDFTLEGETVPFFSERKLYKLLGKQNARSVLSRVNALLEMVMS